MNRAVGLGLRALHFLIALVVLALAVTLLRAQVYGDVPVTTRYSVFTGGFGMLVGLVGVVSLLASFVPEMVPLVLDGLAALFFLAGGIAWAVGLGNTHGCVPDDNMAGNGLLNQGTLDTPEGPFPGVLDPSHPNKDDGTAKLRANCQRATADEVLQFIAFGFGLALLLIGFLQMRRGKSYGAGGYVA